MSRVAMLLVPLAGVLPGCRNPCNPPGDLVVQPRILATDQETYDAGTVAMNDRYTLTIYLDSLGAAPVTVFDVRLEDETDSSWVVLDTWANGTVLHADGEKVPSLTIEAGTPDNPSYTPVEVSFRPTTEGSFRATLIVESTDSNNPDHDPDTGDTITRLTLRGVARSACAWLNPTVYDFGTRPVGAWSLAHGGIGNCGDTTVTVEGFELTGDTDFTFGSPVPDYTLPGSVYDLSASWIPTSAAPAQATLHLITNAPNLTQDITLIGNDDSAAAELTDDDGDGYTEMDGDCDDANAEISPAATEVADEIDNNCDGLIDEGTDTYDDDGDGYAEIDDSGEASDCDDTDPWVYPGAVEDCDGVDNNCDGQIDEGDDPTYGACDYLVERNYSPSNTCEQER